MSRELKGEKKKKRKLCFKQEMVKVDAKYLWSEVITA